MSDTVVQAHPASSLGAGHRQPAFDDARTFVVMLVLLHHAGIAYAVFARFDPRFYLWSSAPIIDPARWFGFDVLYMATEVFFMPLLFLLSGLFVWSGLTRHGPARYLRGRALRLGVPFALGLVLLMPPAYYPSYLTGGGTDGLPAYWWHTVRDGPRPNGPLWFIGVLLLFDAGAAALYRLGIDWSRTPARFVARDAERPLVLFAALLAISLAAYVPALARFGPLRWFAIGPLLVQACRVGLYAAQFGAGIALGRAGGPLLAAQGALARGFRGWLAASGLSCAAFVVWMTLQRGGGVADSPISTAVLFGVTCCAMEFALLAAFLRVAWRRPAAWTSLTANAYGIYLLHYVPLVWLQYALLPLDWGAPAKWAVVLGGTLAVSWAVTALARRSQRVRMIV